MKVRRVGILDEKNEFVLGDLGNQTGILAGVLTEYGRSEESVIAALPVIIGQGAVQRTLKIDIPISRSILEAQRETPTNLDPDKNFKRKARTYCAVFMFRNQVFWVRTDFLRDDLEQEVILLIRRQVFKEDNRLKQLQLEVEAIQRASSQIGVYKRTPIPEVVKLVVWQRDEGKCARCNSTHNLHFDHIIPVDKGGSNSEENIQLLCATCNLGKSNRIAF